MKVIFAGPDSPPFEPADDLRVLVAYRNSAFALRARDLLDRVGNEAGETGRMICSLWNFDSLAVPVLALLALADAKEADLVVFATQEGEALPWDVHLWIARWFLTAPDLPRALVAILDSEPAQAKAPPVVRAYLEKVARNGKMQFFARGCNATAPLHLEALNAQFARDHEIGTVIQQTAGRRSGAPGIYSRVTPAAQGVRPTVS